MLSNQQTKVFKVGDKTYTFSFPNVGKKIDIENFKIALTNGSYGDIARSNHISGNILLDQVDAFAHIVVLVPDMGYKLADFMELNQIDAIKISKIFKEQMKPFLVECQQEIDNLLKEELGDTAEDKN